jgi:hypothetical protein
MVGVALLELQFDTALFLLEERPGTVSVYTSFGSMRGTVELSPKRVVEAQTVDQDGRLTSIYCSCSSR